MILPHSHSKFPDRIALVSWFGAESAALLHLVAAIDRSTPVIFLETRWHFAQTISYRKKLADRFDLTAVRDTRPAAASIDQRDPDGDLCKRDADAC